MPSWREEAKDLGKDARNILQTTYENYSYETILTRKKTESQKSKHNTNHFGKSTPSPKTPLQ